MSGHANRFGWVDVARGIGIILVVYAHVLRGHMPMQDGASWAAAQDHVIYAFHMPLFFVLSGLFVWTSVAKDRPAFVRSRWWQLVWPYLLWSGITAAIEIAMSRFVNSPLTWREALAIPITPIEQYWFLYALLIQQLVIAAAWPRKWLLVPVALAGLALVEALGGAWIQIRAFTFMPYVIGGLLAAGSLFALAERGAAIQAGLALAGWAMFVALYQSELFAAFPFMLPLLLGFSGSAGTIGAAMLLARTPLARGLALLGEASLAIYLAHTIISAGARIALKLLGVAPTDPLSIIAATLGGLIVPLLIWHWVRQRGLNRPLGFGGR